MSVKSIKKALEGVTPGPWVLGDVDDCFVDINAIGARHHIGLARVVWRMVSEKRSPEKEANARYIAAVNPVAIAELLSSLESLQRENERLQAEIDRKSSMPGDHRYWEGRYRDEAAENEKLRKSLEFYATQSNWEDGRFVQDEEPNVVRAIMSTIDSDNGKVARTALASTGGEHNAE